MLISDYVSYNIIICILSFDLTHFRELGQNYRNISVQFLVQMKTSELASEINWPIEFTSFRSGGFTIRSDKTVRRFACRKFSQKRTKEFVCFLPWRVKKQKTNKKNSFVCFLGESTAHRSTYGFIWPLHIPTGWKTGKSPQKGFCYIVLCTTFLSSWNRYCNFSNIEASIFNIKRFNLWIVIHFTFFEFNENAKFK